MLKLISVNMEGEKHFPTVLNLITTERPDVLCLQECPQSFQINLQRLGYMTTFLHMRFTIQNDVAYAEGLVLATTLASTTTHKFYYQPDREVPTQPIPTPEQLKHCGYILGTIDHHGDTYHVATTHVMVTPNGDANEYQTQGVKKLLSLLVTEKPHVLCGDFNIPRGLNPLYEEFCKTYTDCIPREYTSSLDRNLHRHGSKTDLNEPIFDTYMVDYLFAHKEYQVANTRLQFGVSDHAAIVTHLSKTPVNIGS